ncbi:TPA: fimbrial protein [Klebsiella variicola]|nr:fimbrial protein [Klebsiella variicola]
MNFKTPIKLAQINVCLLFFILLIEVRDGYAAGYFYPYYSHITLPATIDIPNMTSPGQVLWTSARINTTLRDGVTSRSRFSTRVNGGILSTYGNNVYETGVKGIGFRIVGNFKTPLTSLNMIFGEESDLYDWPGDQSLFVTQEAYLELVSTSDAIESGTINLSNIYGRVAFNYQDGDRQQWNIRITGTPVVKRACGIINTTISVPMGEIKKLSFNGPGTWPGDANTRKFAISLNCDVGARINLKIDGDIQNAEQGIVNISEGDNSASGIGIQLLFNNKPIILSNQIDIGKATNNVNYSIPLQARYYQIREKITPGKANAIATFTLTYN